MFSSACRQLIIVELTIFVNEISKKRGLIEIRILKLC